MAANFQDGRHRGPMKTMHLLSADLIMQIWCDWCHCHGFGGGWIDLEHFHVSKIPRWPPISKMDAAKATKTINLLIYPEVIMQIWWDWCYFSSFLGELLNRFRTFSCLLNFKMATNIQDGRLRSTQSLKHLMVGHNDAFMARLLASLIKILYGFGDAELCANTFMFLTF